MRKTNYHTHTKRCMHASGSDEEYVLAAITNGYEELGFSDHTPWDYETDYIAHMRMKLSEFDDYYNSISYLKEKYKDQISIKIGLECEYFPKYMAWLKNFVAQKKLDYIIFGNHYLKTDENHIYFGTACKQKSMLRAYVDEAIAGLETGLYAYLCHPDLFMRSVKNFDDFTKQESVRLCKACKRLNIPLEYNLAGAKYNEVMHVMQYPHEAFWRVASQNNNKVIIGVDAHDPRALLDDHLRKEAITFLEGLHMEIVDHL